MCVIKNLTTIPDTLNLLAQWHQSEWAKFNPGETLEQRMVRMHDYLNPDFIPSTFVALDDCVLGSGAIVKNDMDSRPELSPWLASVYVLPGHRGRGIGSKLVQHIMSQAKSETYKKLYLFTTDKQDFYEKLGWQTFDVENYHGQQVNLMQVFL